MRLFLIKAKMVSEKVRRDIRKFVESTKKEARQTRTPIKYITAYDPRVGKRVVFIVKDGIATSLVSGHQFYYYG